MCGIVGLVAVPRSPDESRGLVAAMAERIRHRGPDGGGVLAHEDATLGMTRLAIVDVVHGHQPMANDDASVVLVFNGEIYNAPALRKTLEAEGVEFRTRSDTEVILRLYERDPQRVEQELRGMWAFAIHDRRRRRVVLSRDRFGIKPLFILDTGRALAFASELRCFDRALPELASAFDIDHAAAHAMLSWSYVPGTATIYRGIRRVEPATRVEIDLETGERRTRRTWTLVPDQTASRISSLDEACEAVEALLRNAVREHLESDVPIATFLSGGIDSSLVTALAQEASSNPLKAYTVGFREPRFDESPFARATADKLGVPIEVQILDEQTARRALGEVLLAYDEPFGDSSSVATFLLSRHVGKDYKVALGGDGGDEVFAGYKKHQILRARRPFEAAPILRDTLARVLGRLPTRTDRTRGWTEALRTVRRLARGLEGSDARGYAALTQVAPLARTAALVAHPGAQLCVDEIVHRFESGSGDALARTLAGDLANVLPNDMLVKVDRASMACHLEVRVPFLDHRLVELGVGLPAQFTLGTKGKRVLRALHERRFGAALANRRKQGFGVPIEAWLRGPFDRACTTLFDRRRVEKYDVLSSALSDGGHRRWLATDPILVWHAFALAAWCEANLGDGPNEVRTIFESGEKL